MKKNLAISSILFLGVIFICSSKNTVAQALDSIPISSQQQIVLHAAAINEDRAIWIHTPSGYDASTDTYPVLYLLDGGSHFKYVCEMVDRLSDFETPYIPPMIVVAIPNTNRGRDFTPVFDTNDSTATHNGAANFLSFIKNELIPYIDKNYRTQPYRILEAHSLGGLFGVYANETEPGLFRASIIISPALTGDENKVKVMKGFAFYLKNNKQLNNKMFVTIGDEGKQAVNLLTGQLKAFAPKTFKWAFKEYTNENHFSVPFKSMYDGLRFIYANWYFSVFLNPKKISFADIENHYKKLSAAFGYTIQPTEDFLNQSGYQQLRSKHMEEAIEIFKQNIQAHPTSFNVYDSMGEAYMANGDKALAIINYEKSIAINPNNEGGKEMLKKLKGER